MYEKWDGGCKWKLNLFLHLDTGSIRIEYLCTGHELSLELTVKFALDFEQIYYAVNFN